MWRCFRRLAATLAVAALLVNLAGHVAHAASMGSLETPEADGPLLIICTSQGTQVLVWTADGYVPLPDQSGQGKQPCPLCASLAGGALLPPAVLLAASLELIVEPVSRPESRAPQPVPAYATPLVRAPPRVSLL
ncbi:DUF2946 family protein [Algihabitans albus]|uniref:DUF2946 family protein n=1 Tax=Algihabitans albus TaxID=2164067 RepID=UPI000E5C9C42|nr:DUF2946 family protein [Algihabitans albus]